MLLFIADIPIFQIVQYQKLGMSDLLAPKNAGNFFLTMLHQNKVVLISATYCHYCVRAKTLLIQAGVRFVSLEIDIIPNGREVFEQSQSRSQSNSVPQIYINKLYIGGYDELLKLHDEGKLKEMAQGD